MHSRDLPGRAGPRTRNRNQIKDLQKPDVPGRINEQTKTIYSKGDIMIWEWLAKEFLVKGTVGDLVVIFFCGLIVGVFAIIAVFNIVKLKKQLQGKKKGDEK